MFFSRFKYHMFYILYPFVTYLLTLLIAYAAEWEVASFVLKYLSLWSSLYNSEEASLFLQHHISKLNLPILMFSCGHQSWYRH
jgi:hypothetical protein